jgi:hypothetical protein
VNVDRHGLVRQRLELVPRPACYRCVRDRAARSPRPRARCAASDRPRARESRASRTARAAVGRRSPTVVGGREILERRMARSRRLSGIRILSNRAGCCRECRLLKHAPLPRNTRLVCRAHLHEDICYCVDSSWSACLS